MAEKIRKMEPTEYIWHNGKFVKWDDAKVHMLTHTLHYGAGAFEGIRFYKTDRGPAVFRLEEHMDRLEYSSKAIAIEPQYSVEELSKATVELISKNKIDQGYIRPLVFYGYGIMGLNPTAAPIETSIAVWPWGSYLPHEAIDVKISNYIRIHPKSTVSDAKICGHYVNSILAVVELRGTHYHEAMLLDSEGKIAEGPGENFFMIKDGKLLTPPLGSILVGVTRKTIMELAEAHGIEVLQQPITPQDAFAADEAFYTGTAAEVTPIRSIDDKVIGNGGVGPLTQKLKDAYLDVVYGRNAEYQHYLTYVES